MVEPAILGAAFTAGLLSAASPCVLAAVPVTVGFVGGGATGGRDALRLTLGFIAGMIGAFVVLGLAAARLGMFFGTLGPSWTALGGVIIVAGGIVLFMNWNSGALCPAGLTGWMQSHLGGTGLAGAVWLTKHLILPVEKNWL